MLDEHAGAPGSFIIDPVKGVRVPVETPINPEDNVEVNEATAIDPPAAKKNALNLGVK